MKLVVMIPAFNECDSIQEIIKRIPKIEGIIVEILVIDDGSTDNTGELAKASGAYVLKQYQNQGLGKALRRGLSESIKMGADIIVNIDADGQYNPEDIPELINPIIMNQADLVLASRFEKIQYKMPRIKRWGNKFMTNVIRSITDLPIKDAQTGFRAISRPLAQTLEILLKGDYTYTQEMIIHAKFNGFKILDMPMTFNERKHGDSRLIQNPFSYFVKVFRILLQTYRYYKPLQFFGISALFFMILGFAALYLDQQSSLEGLHIIPSVNITNDPKILLTIAVPFFLAINFFIFGLILDSINTSRTNLINSNIQLKQELYEMKRSIEKLDPKHMNH